MPQDSRPTRIYLAGALLGADDLEQACAAYDRLAAELRAYGLDVYVPHEHTHPEVTSSFGPREVFDRGMAAIRSCNVVLALLDEPSLGVGAEVALAVQHEKRVLGAHRSGGRVSRFALGLIHRAPRTHVLEFDDLSDLAAQVAERVSRTSSIESGDADTDAGDSVSDSAE